MIKELALQSSSSTDLVEDKSFLESLHVHEKSSFVCVLCEEVAVSGGELSDHSLHPFQQPKKPSSQDEQLHNKHPRSSLLRSAELEEARSQRRRSHTYSQSACVYDLPDLAWKDPACMFRGHLSKSQPSAKDSGQRGDPQACSSTQAQEAQRVKWTLELNLRQLCILW